MAERANEPRVLAPAARFILQGGVRARKPQATAFGVSLPETACRANAADGRAALWLGPDEQLLLGAGRQTRKASSVELEAALSGSRIRWWRSANVRSQCK